MVRRASKQLRIREDTLKKLHRIKLDKELHSLDETIDYVISDEIYKKKKRSPPGDFW